MELIADGLIQLADRLRRIHPELDPSWANLMELYAKSWLHQLGEYEKQRQDFNAIWNSNQDQIALIQQTANDEKRRADELMLERDSMARDAWRREKGLEDGVFQ